MAKFLTTLPHAEEMVRHRTMTAKVAEKNTDLIGATLRLVDRIGQYLVRRAFRRKEQSTSYAPRPQEFFTP